MKEFETLLDDMNAELSELHVHVSQQLILCFAQAALHFLFDHQGDLRL